MAHPDQNGSICIEQLLCSDAQKGLELRHFNDGCNQSVTMTRAVESLQAGIVNCFRRAITVDGPNCVRNRPTNRRLQLHRFSFTEAEPSDHIV